MRLLWITFAIVGVGLVIVAFLESNGLVTYRPNRQPIGAPAWLSAGAVCLLIAAVLSKWKK